MSELDRLLAQAEAQQNSDEWEVLNKYRREVTYVDDDGYVNIVGRKIDTIRENVSVQGEQYSQYIEFLMDRFYDGVDLAEQTIAIHYEVEGNGGEDAPINVYKNSTQLKFGWLIGPNVAQYAQPVEFCIWVRGTLINGNKYVLKTLPQIYTPKRGLVLGGGIPKPDNNWYLQFSLSMDEKVNQSALNASQAASSANEAKTSEIVVLQAQQEVSQKSEVVDTQYKEIKIMHQEAEQYRDEAEQFRNEAEQFTPDGYSDLVEQVNKNTVAVNTIVEKADLGIKETASGEEIYLFDSSNGKPPEFSMYGKVTQNTTSGKNKLKCKSVRSQTINGVTFTVNDDGSIHAKGTASDRVTFFVDTLEAEEINKFNGFKLSGGTGGTIFYIESTDTYTKFATNTGTDATITIPDGNSERAAIFYRISNGVPVDDMLYPMISLEGGEYEPYTGGIPSPNPDYPQDIDVSGESYNLLNNPQSTSTSKEVSFQTDKDGITVANGTATDGMASYNPGNRIILKEGKYILSGCPKGGSDSTYRMILGLKYSDGTYYSDIKDYGDGKEFTITKGMLDIGVYGLLFFYVFQGYSASDLTFKPMIRKASVKNNRYMPYGKGSVEVKSVGENLLKNTDYEVGSYSPVTGSPVSNNSLYRFNKPISVSIGETLYFTKSLVAFWYSGTEDNLTFISDNSQSLLERVVPTNATFVKFRTFSSDFPNFNNNDYMVSKRPITEYQPYKETISTIPTTDFAGIKVSSNGNYTDSNGQQWVCDEIVKYADGSGEKIQRIAEYICDGTKNFSNYTDSVGKQYPCFMSNILSGRSAEYYNNELCSHNKVAYMQELINGNVLGFTGNTNPTYANYAYISVEHKTIGTTTESTSTELTTSFNTWVKAQYDNGTPLTFKYVLAEPLRIPLTAEEIAEIEKLSTFHPVTNISNDFDCGMKVTYVVDAKNYIDNKLAQIAAAVVNNI